jgi:hypothetical protein
LGFAKNFKTAVLDVWGDTPTVVEEPIPANNENVIDKTDNDFEPIPVEELNR